MSKKASMTESNIYCVSDAQKQIEALVERASAGESILISVRGTPVVRMVSLSDSENGKPAE